ncbi:MAG: hypothetical protein MJY62_00305 [Bacteroidales bacterium]|nr:hypothetical protein [Bacteroidales bacterium]
MKKILSVIFSAFFGVFSIGASAQSEVADSSRVMLDSIINTTAPTKTVVRYALRSSKGSKVDIGPGAFWGIKGGVNLGNYEKFDIAKNSENKDTLVRVPSRNLSVNVIPTIGYFFNDWCFAGMKATYTFSVANSSTMLEDWLYGQFETVAKAKCDLHTFKATPYVRYRIASLFNYRLGLWIEAGAYVGFNIYQTGHGSDRQSFTELTYGVGLHPMLSYNITSRWYLFTSLDLISLNYDGYFFKNPSTGNKEFYNNLDFNYNPVKALGRMVIGFGIIKRM